MLLKLLPHLLLESNESMEVLTFSGMFMVKLQLFSYFGEVVRESSRAVSVSILRWCPDGCWALIQDKDVLPV